MNRILEAIQGIDVEPFLLEPCIPVSNIVNFVRWYEERGGLFEDLALPFDRSEFEGKESGKWLNYLQHLAFQKSIIDRIDGFSLSMYYDMGYRMTRNKMITPYKIILGFLPLDRLLQKIAEVARTLQTYARLTVLESGDDFCRMRYDLDPRYNRYNLGGLTHNITGTVCAAISIRFGVECAYRIVQSQNLLENVVSAAYQRYGFSFEEIDGNVLVDGEKIGERSPAQAEGGPRPVRIVRDLRKNGVTLLESGMVFDAPHCEVEISWEKKLSLPTRIHFRLDRLFARARAAEELQRRIEAVQRNFFEATAAKEEAQRLSSELAAKNFALEDLTRNLERKVEERTVQLNETLARLEHMDVVKTNLLATVSHELRTPLALIKGPLERMVRGELGGSIEPSDPSLVSAVRQAQRLEDVLDGILDFTMLELDRSAIAARPFDLARLLAEALDEASFAASVASVRLASSLPPRGEAVVVEGEPRLVKTAISNLLSNAVKYTPRGGSVEVALGAEDGRARVEVRDTGIGIDPAEKDRIFERFYRVEAEGKPKGAGLGLYLVKEIAALHGGEVRVESRKGAGSTFTLLLPLSASLPAAAADPARGPALSFVRAAMPELEPEAARTARGPEPDPATRQATGPGARLLLVEDNAELAEFLRSGLAREAETGRGYDVEVAADGEAALRALEARRFDLVVSDVMMPGMDGIELLRRSAALGDTRPPFLFLTAKADEATKVAALDEGALDYIRKPFDEPELRKKIGNIVDYGRRLARLESEGGLESAVRDAAERLGTRGLSEREVEVAALLGEGRSKKEIASELGISVATAKRHVENIYEKLGISDRYQLFAEFFQRRP